MRSRPVARKNSFVERTGLGAVGHGAARPDEVLKGGGMGGFQRQGKDEEADTVMGRRWDGRAKEYARSINLAIWMEWL